jgi:hypothetical protein
MKLTTEQLVELRAVVTERMMVRTHWHDCFYDSGHRDCAIIRLLEHIDEIRKAAPPSTEGGG